jgi:UrcA family protein
MNTTHHTAAWTLVAATLCAVFTAGAQAAEVAQIHVKYADLNVNNPAGAAVLLQRIHAAAVKVCRVPASRELDVASKATACITKATADAVAAVNAPALTGLYQAKVGGNTQLATVR